MRRKVKDKKAEERKGKRTMKENNGLQNDGKGRRK